MRMEYGRGTSVRRHRQSGISGEGRGLLAGFGRRQGAAIRTGIAMRNVGGRNDRRGGNLAAEAGAKIVAGDAQLAGMRGQALALVQNVLDRVR